MIEIKPYIEHAVLVGLITPSQPEDRTKEYLDELAFLADTHGIVPAKRFTQRLDQPNTATYVGEGKLEEIDQFIQTSPLSFPQGRETVIDVVIFDDELSPRQIRNIEKALNHKGKPDVRVIDRTILILEIFLQRAQTSYAKTQVEMAHLQYMLPRLTRMWSHLDRQRGGGGTNRGMGETQIEADKQNKLFATLDTTVRKVTIENLPFLLSDTVGFIRKLPHHLVESFKSTLDEVREADLLIHVVDISHPNFEEQYEVVEQTIREITSPQPSPQERESKKERNPWERVSSLESKPGGVPIPQIVVFNKIDNFTYTPKEEDDLTPFQRENYSLEDLQKTWMARLGEDCIFISAKNKENIDTLRKLMYDRIKAIHVKRYPYNDFLFQHYEDD